MLSKLVKQLFNREARDSAQESERSKYRTIWTHEQYRHFSPGLRAMQKFQVVERFRSVEVKTVLDAGCGSGKLMRYLIENCGNEFDVKGFDIADNCLDDFFKGREKDFLRVGCLWEPRDFKKNFDAVVCVDVLEHIPVEKVPAVLQNLRRSAAKFCYLGIALSEDHFGPVLLGEPLHLTVKPSHWWLDRIREAGFPAFDEYYIEKNEQGGEEWLHVFIPMQQAIP